MLHLTNAFLVCPLLLLLTPLVAFGQWGVLVALGKRVKHLYIKEGPFLLIHPKPVAWMSTLAPSVVIVLPSASHSTDNVWRVGSTETPWHTSVMRLAVMSLSSLCLTMRKPPIGQLKACSTLNGFPHIHSEAKSFGSWSTHI